MARYHRPEMNRSGKQVAALALLVALGCAPAGEETAVDETAASTAVHVRIALFNIRELKTEKLLEVDENGRGIHPQARAAAKIVRRLEPDVLILNEIDHDYGSDAEDLALNARRFRDAYLASGYEPPDLPYAWAVANNTGLLSGLDLDGDGHVAGDEDRGSRQHGNDSFGYGTYPGEFSMAILSRYPILEQEVRTFQKLLWKDLPGHHIPDALFPREVLEVFRLSSKSHWDVPLDIDGERLHLFVSHPTPQGFDGEEDKNGRRNFDEIKLWVEYLDAGEELIDDRGRRGGYESTAPFVIAGDLNAAPLTGDNGGDGPFRISVYDEQAAIDQLLRHPRIQDSGPFVTSHGALAHRVEEPRRAGPPGFPERSTSVFGPGARIDYILPSVDIEIEDGGVFWPTAEEDAEGARWADDASDHRLVWLDLALPRDH